MDFGLFHTWNVLYDGGTVPWDPEYGGGKLLEEAAYVKNWDEMQAVEEMGWDYIGRGGGHFARQASMARQPFLLPAALASRTRRIKIGTSVHRPVLRQPGETVSARALPHERYAFDHLMLEDPLQVAEQVAIVDQFSQGRFIYGAGGRTRGAEARREQFFEFLGGMQPLWTEEHFSRVRGQYYHYPALLEPYLAIPKAHHKPYPPTMVPGG